MYLKVYFVLCICISQQLNTIALLNNLHFGPECISLFKLLKATKILCENRNDATLWQQVIDCHVPISEQFLRESAEARCPIPKEVEDPTDTDYTIQDVFFNICGLVEGNLLDISKGASCLVFGNKNIMSHAEEVKTLKARWGDDVPCNIGKCVLDIFPDL